MSDKEMHEIIKMLIRDLGHMQAVNLANNYILMEIVADLSKLTKDRDRYIADLFERINARADQGRIEDEAHPVQAEFRRTIEIFFSTLANSKRREE